MASGSEAAPVFDLKPSFGALYIGVLTAIGLLGITTLQTWLYYSRYPNDPRGLRIIVAVIWVLELLHSAFGAHALYHYVILNWGNPEALAHSIWSLDITLLITSVVETMVRVFFMWRVWIVSGYKWYYPALVGFFGLCALGFNVATYGLSVAEKDFANFGHSIYVVSTSGLSSSIAADSTISICLAYFLNSRRTGFSKTNRLINRLIFFAINIGILTSLTDVAVLSCSSALKGPSLAYLSVYEVVSKLYANSLLATLNIRAVDSKSATDSTDFRMSEIRSHANSSKGSASNARFASGTLVPGKAMSAAGSTTEMNASLENKVYAYGPPVTVSFEKPEGAV
ncbi:hypothetical protein DFH11DRAFT_1636363 [Phellopilus nigrolimitatus]|nr:hypothetical protein DFH11DRAFT_1636363 [Phellopilus nigrolimitatus]